MGGSNFVSLTGIDKRGKKCFLQHICQNLAVLEVKTLRPTIQETLFYRLEFEKHEKCINND